MKLEAVLFDMDGVLVDSTHAWHKAFNEIARLNNVDEITYEYYEHEQAGNSINLDIEKYFPHYDLTELSNLYLTYLGKHVDDIILFDGVFEVLDFLDDNGIQKAIVTNSPRDCTKLIVENFNLENRFDKVLTGEDVKQGKPNPEMLITALQLLDKKPDNAVMVGDTINDVKAARSAGLKVIGVQINSDYRIEKISDLLNILEIFL